MFIPLPNTLLDEKNDKYWNFDGWRAVAKPNAPPEVKEACEQHNKNVTANVDIDEDED